MDRDLLKNAIRQNRLKVYTSSNKPQFPSAPQMAKNLGNDVIKNVKSVLAGNPLSVEESEANRRKAICKSCEYFNASQERCTKCGCFMAVKAYLKASSCPIGKW